MKKNLFMVAAVALMAMVSCNKEEIGNNGVEGGQASDIVFSAELEQPDGGAAVAPAAAQTKTSLGEAVGNVHPVTWNAGDKIKVNGVEFSATADGSRTDFTTTASFTEAATYYAVYPASAAGAAGLTKVTIPASQKGTFAEAAISVAQSNTQSLHFKNLASILKFQVPAACSEVTIESTSNLAGTFPVTFDDKGLPVIGTVTNGSKKITLTGSFVTGTDYYAAVLPGSHTFTIRLDGYLSKASTTAVTTKRAVSSNLKTLPAPVEWEWFITGDSAKIYMVKSETYTDLFVANKVALSSDFKFKFIDKTAAKTVGAWGTSTTNVDCKDLINSWYGSDATNQYAAKIFVSTSGEYDIYFSPTNLDFLIIKSGIEEENSSWEIVGWINGKDSWGGNSGYILKTNYITSELSITMPLTNGDYFKILKNKNWNAGPSGGWIGAPGNDGETKNYTLSSGQTSTVSTYHSYNDHKAQFHMVNNGTYKIVVVVSDDAYTSATVKIYRTK